MYLGVKHQDFYARVRSRDKKALEAWVQVRFKNTCQLGEFTESRMLKTFFCWGRIRRRTRPDLRYISLGEMVFDQNLKTLRTYLP
jgi:hypothetical protein